MGTWKILQAGFVVCTAESLDLLALGIELLVLQGKREERIVSSELVMFGKEVVRPAENQAFSGRRGRAGVLKRLRNDILR